MRKCVIDASNDVRFLIQYCFLPSKASGPSINIKLTPRGLFWDEYCLGEMAVIWSQMSRPMDKYAGKIAK